MATPEVRLNKLPPGLADTVDRLVQHALAKIKEQEAEEARRLRAESLRHEKRKLVQRLREIEGETGEFHRCENCRDVGDEDLAALRHRTKARREERTRT